MRIMIKYLFLILPLILNFELSPAQIPNGGFELWEEELTYEKPIGWNTNQDTIFPRFEKDTNSIEGNYSLKIIPGVTSSWDGCESRATMHVDFGTPLPSNSVLSFYAKSLPFDSVQNEAIYLRINIYTYDGDTPLTTYEWKTFTAIENFTKVEMSLMDESATEAFIFINGGAIPDATDGPCHNRSFSWIDGMTIESGTSDEISSEQDAPIVSVYPNPSNGAIHINSADGKIVRYELYSLIGELISNGQIENDELTIYNQGIYILKLVVDYDIHPVYTNKLIVVK